MNICAGVAKLGQRREIMNLTRCSEEMISAEKPHLLGVRGFKSHPPHLSYMISK